MPRDEATREECAQPTTAWRIRLVDQDIALSRRRSRVRIPYALPTKNKSVSKNSLQAVLDADLFFTISVYVATL